MTPPDALPVLPDSAAESPLSENLAGLAGRAAAFARATTAKSTRRAYDRDWRHFTAWCAVHGAVPLPASPQVVGLYLTHCAERLAVATLSRRLAAISTAHRLHGHRLDTRHPAIHDVLRGIRRTKGTAQRQVTAATTPLLRAMLSTCDNSLTGTRDRALLLLGFAAALRRSEIVALESSDLADVPEGLRLTIRRSKTDQDAAGDIIGIVRTGSVTCPVAALRAWCDAAAITEGRLFRKIDRHGNCGTGLTDQSVALLVKKRAALAGYNPTNYSGHSLRAGFATSAAQNGVEERLIARTTRHRSMTVLRGYVRDGDLFLGAASGRVGL
ncbi:site-specific integrase [Herbaspirillum huttiense]|uniref:site-specific integrase n=1 Tax=Herbaspirillum huttiense TaxID=863372 RepID=UPI003B3B9D09